MKEALFLSTDAVEPAHRNEYWREIVRPFFHVQSHDDDARHLEGSLGARLLGELWVAHFTHSAQRCWRNRHLVAQSGLDEFYLIQLYQSGTLEADCQGRVLSAGPGDIAVLDFSRTWTGSGSAGANVSIVMARGAIDRTLGERALHGAVLRAGSPVTRLLSDVIGGLATLPTDGSGADLLAVGDAMLALIISAIRHGTPDGTPDEFGAGHSLRRRVLQFVDANLTSPDLDLAMLMRRFRVSRSHLYRIFADDGGVRAVVRDRRLDAAYRELTGPQGTARSITRIAHEFGFSSSNQFLRAFRMRFGITPSKVLQEGPLLKNKQLADIQRHLVRLKR